jgi:hypothetical protein
MPPNQIAGILPVQVTPGLEGGVLRFEGTDPRMGMGRAGISGLNFAHDAFLAANPNARDVLWESDDTGRFRITGGEQYRQGIMNALSAPAFDPVVAAGYQPGLGEFDRSYQGDRFRHYGYQDPGTGKFAFSGLDGGVLKTPARPPATATNLPLVFNPYTGQWVYENDLRPVSPDDLQAAPAVVDPNAPAFEPEYRGAAAGSALPSGAPAFDYPSLLLGVPMTPERFAMQSRYYYGSPLAPVLAQWRTPAPPPPPSTASVRRPPRIVTPPGTPPGAADPWMGGGGEPSGSPGFDPISGSYTDPGGGISGGNVGPGDTAPGMDGPGGFGGATPFDAGGWVTPRGPRMVRQPMSDSIPGRLSAGEFVVNADAARQPGVGRYLETLNNGGARRARPTMAAANPEAW